MTWRERIALAVAAIAVPVAIVLGVFAVDVLRTPGWISADDARFRDFLATLAYPCADETANPAYRLFLA